MPKRMIPAVMAGVLLVASPGWSADQQPSRTQAQVQAEEQEQIYGSQIMTPEERAQYRDRMRAAATEEERQRIRREHHEEMKIRAAKRGITLPDEPPERGMGRGMGPGGGMGPGPGGGMGGGRR